jgi:hypothetical protein
MPRAGRRVAENPHVSLDALGPLGPARVRGRKGAPDDVHKAGMGSLVAKIFAILPFQEVQAYAAININ